MSRFPDAISRTSARAGAAGEAFDALADPTRREILAILAQEGACSAGVLAEQITSVGRTAVSTHLRILRTAGLVHRRREGKYLYYELDPEGSAREVIDLVHTLFKDSLEKAAQAAERGRPPQALDSGRQAEGTGS
jgi:ArsR family transcriptional regulator